MDEADESLTATNSDVEIEVKELLGLFDVPAFARRGHDLDELLRRLQDRCRRARYERLDMVRMRLRQWSRAATGPESWSDVFARPIETLWPLSEAEDPCWATSPATLRQRRNIARDLVAAVLRFNHRWTEFLARLNLGPTNAAIDQYNRYYVLEKECVMGSARLAARHFQPLPEVTIDRLLQEHPLLCVPELCESGPPGNRG